MSRDHAQDEDALLPWLTCQRQSGRAGIQFPTRSSPSLGCQLTPKLVSTSLGRFSPLTSHTQIPTWASSTDSVKGEGRPCSLIPAPQTCASLVTLRGPSCQPRLTSLLPTVPGQAHCPALWLCLLYPLHASASGAGPPVDPRPWPEHPSYSPCPQAPRCRPSLPPAPYWPREPLVPPQLHPSQSHLHKGRHPPFT